MSFPQSHSQRSRPTSDRSVGSANAERDLSVCSGPTPKLNDSVDVDEAQGPAAILTKKNMVRCNVTSAGAAIMKSSIDQVCFRIQLSLRTPVGSKKQ